MSGPSTSQPFNAQIDAWIKKAGGRVNQVYDATVHDVVARLKELTPVRTGYLRSNWIAVEAGDALPVGTSGEIGLGIVDLKLARSTIILNPVKYAARINFGFVGPDRLGRHYHQQGRHMVEQVMQELPAIAQNACERIVQGGQ